MQGLVVIHTVISLVAIAFGLVAVLSMYRPGLPAFWTGGFLVLAVATTETGFLLPFSGLTPAVVTGVVATLVLAVVLAARYVFGLRGGWRTAYAVGVVTSLYLLVFVGIAQTFQKIAPFHALAPTGTEPAFAVAQFVGLALFVALGISAVRGFRRMTVS
jgi:hypothetical protein